MVKDNCLKNVCYHLPQLNRSLLNEPCVEGDSYDYFENSQLSFILTFLFLATCLAGKFYKLLKTLFFILKISGTLGLTFLLVNLREMWNNKSMILTSKKLATKTMNFDELTGEMFIGRYKISN